MLSRWVHRLLAVRADRWVLMALLLLLVYFGYHTLRGPHGLFAALELDREIGAARGELDERVRATLGLIHGDEVIVLRDGAVEPGDAPGRD